MEEYANAAQTQSRAGLLSGVGAKIQERPLDRISIAADRLERLAERVQSFNDRFHGNPAPEPTINIAKAPTPYGHNNNLARLFDAIDCIETQINILSDLG